MGDAPGTEVTCVLKVEHDWKTYEKRTFWKCEFAKNKPTADFRRAWTFVWRVDQTFDQASNLRITSPMYFLIPAYVILQYNRFLREPDFRVLSLCLLVICYCSWCPMAYLFVQNSFHWSAEGRGAGFISWALRRWTCKALAWPCYSTLKGLASRSKSLILRKIRRRKKRLNRMTGKHAMHEGHVYLA